MTVGEMYTPEVLTYTLEASMGLLTLAMAFSKSIKKEVYEKQKGNCADCGEHYPRLQTHHRVPHSLGGPDTIENAVGLCQDDHRVADRLAFQGIIHPQIHGNG